MSVCGKVVVITGATRGIGRAIAEECVRQGAHVVGCGRTQQAVDEMLGGLHALGGPEPLGVVADVSRYADVEALRDAALARHHRIDAWLNNAGISLGYCPLDEMSAEELERIVAINLTGHIFGCRAILPHFRAHGGYVLNMAGRGYRGEATPHTAAYAATKTAIASLTRSLAAENRDAPNVSVNALVPGMVATDFYRDIRCSPRLESTKDNWRYALDAFGVPIERVASETALLLGSEPGKETGAIHSLITRRQMLTGVAKMAWWGMTGKMTRD